LHQVSLKSPNGSGGVNKMKYFKENAKSRGCNALKNNWTPPPIISTSKQCDLPLYQVSSKSPEGFKGHVHRFSGIFLFFAMHN
jgi:hypothetical protein